MDLPGMQWCRFLTLSVPEGLTLVGQVNSVDTRWLSISGPSLSNYHCIEQYHTVLVG